ncbi:MAG: biotin transporter BioY [Clostridia bacterium]|nr:biotin transporter BioY [Clostridia bacterium]
MNSKTKNIVLTGLMAAIISVIAVWQIPLPFGVPLTFQIFAVALSGYTLGRRRGTLAAFLYIAIGAVGIPVFTGFRGGLSVVAGPGGGFIIGFLLVAFLCGVGSHKKTAASLLLGFSGLILCHTAGTFYYSFVQDTPFAASFFAVSLPYILKDCVLISFAYFLSLPIKKHI